MHCTESKRVTAAVEGAPGTAFDSAGLPKKKIVNQKETPGRVTENVDRFKQELAKLRLLENNHAQDSSTERHASGSNENPSSGQELSGSSGASVQVNLQRLQHTVTAVTGSQKVIYYVVFL